MRTFFKEFRDFIATGNMVELAVAVILATAVGAVIRAFTDGIMMQVVAAVFGQPDFSDITITLRKNVATTETVDVATGETTTRTFDSVLQIGTFVNAVISLILTGLVLFVIIKAYNRMSSQSAAVVAEAPTELGLLAEIRDLLVEQRRP